MTINVNLSRISDALERIATSLESAIPPIDLDRRAVMKKRGPEAIIRYGDNKTSWLKENFANLIHERGLAPAQEQEVLDQVMEEWGEEDPEGS